MNRNSVLMRIGELVKSGASPTRSGDDEPTAQEVQKHYNCKKR